MSSSVPPDSGKLEQATDGKKGHEEVNVIELPAGPQWVQLDLEAEHELSALLLWHNHHGSLVYFDVIGQASNDPAFEKGVTTFFNSDFENKIGFGKGKDKCYLERYDGRLIDLKGQRARYLRFYGNGNNRNKKNHVLEIEVWGKKSTSAPDAEKVPLEFEFPEQYFGGPPL